MKHVRLPSGAKEALVLGQLNPSFFIHSGKPTPNGLQILKKFKIILEGYGLINSKGKLTKKGKAWKDPAEDVIILQETPNNFYVNGAEVYNGLTNAFRTIRKAGHKGVIKVRLLNGIILKPVK